MHVKAAFLNTVFIVVTFPTMGPGFAGAFTGKGKGAAATLKHGMSHCQMNQSNLNIQQLRRYLMAQRKDTYATYMNDLFMLPWLFLEMQRLDPEGRFTLINSTAARIRIFYPPYADMKYGIFKSRCLLN